MPLSYESSGVGIDRGNAWIEVIKKLVKNGKKDERLLGGIGGFSGLYRITDELLIAACCDGVGTKVELARETGLFEGLGQDLVAMNVNDLVTCGAKPLFFLDYIACGQLDASKYAPVLKGIVNACTESDCVLLGGETAEMPGVYSKEGLDLAGFSVGMVKESELIDGKTVCPGDLLIGIPSSGVHSNGFSLVRKLIKERGLSLDTEYPGLGKKLGELLLSPTRLYVKPVLSIIKTGMVKAMAHITGGGLEENIVRVLNGNKAQIDFGAWKRPAIFSFFNEQGIEEEELRRVFNIGIGFVFVIAQNDKEPFFKALEGLNEKACCIGKVQA